MRYKRLILTGGLLLLAAGGVALTLHESPPPSLNEASEKYTLVTPEMHDRLLWPPAMILDLHNCEWVTTSCECLTRGPYIYDPLGFYQTQIMVIQAQLVVSDLVHDLWERRAREREAKEQLQLKMQELSEQLDRLERELDQITYRRYRARQLP